MHQITIGSFLIGSLLLFEIGRRDWRHTPVLREYVLRGVAVLFVAALADLAYERFFQ